MNYLDAILVHANTRLMQMTAGQYELERVGAENQRSQSGLDLGVIDHYNGTRRSVKTLSGGESFKASLALALGLSDEVQRAASGWTPSSSMKASARWTTRALSRPSGSSPASPRATASWASSPTSPRSRSASTNRWS